MSDIRISLKPGRHVTEASAPPGVPAREFEIVKELGRGGLGITYRAFDSRQGIGREVALKEYFPQDFAYRKDNDTLVYPNEDQSQAQLFELCRNAFSQEAQQIARFTHSSIVKVHAPFLANNTTYFPMEFIPGKSLEDRLGSGPMAWRDLEPLYFKLLSALEEMHDLDVFHLDIKPSNIMLRSDNTPVFIDFGSARQRRIASDTNSLQSSGLRFESVGYSPPEQTGGGTLGPHSDIFSLCATGYRCLSGHKDLPRAPMPSALIQERLRGKGVPEAVALALARGMSERVADRPTIDELRAMLSGEIIDPPIDSERPGKDGPAPGKRSGRALDSVLAAVFGLMFASLTAALLSQSLR